jgi:hypothetical protein
MPVSYEVPIIFVSLVILVLFFSTAVSVQSISNPVNACMTPTGSSVANGIRISIVTDTQQYSPGQVVQISGNVTNSTTGKPINEMLSLNILNPSGKSVGGEQTCTPGGKFGYNLTNTQQGGPYTIIVSTNGFKANTTITATDLFGYSSYGLLTGQGIPLLATIAGLGFVVILVYILLWLPGRVTSEFTKTDKKEKSDQDFRPPPLMKVFVEKWAEQQPLSPQFPEDKRVVDTNNPLKKTDSHGDNIIKAYHELFEVQRNLQRARTWRFICISGMVASLITIYAFTPGEIGVNSFFRFSQNP